jgi:hypothetical protein
MKDKLGIEDYLNEGELSSKLLPLSLESLPLSHKKWDEHGAWRDFVNERRREKKWVFIGKKMQRIKIS